MPTNDNPVIEALYRRRADAFFAAEKRFAFREQIVMHLRVATFLLAAVMVIAGWNSGEPLLWFAVAAVIVGGFTAAVAYHEYIQHQMQRNRLLGQINEEAIARLHRRWHGLSRTDVEVSPEHQAVAVDLDLLGHASLFHLVCTAKTPLGIRLLRDWLLEPASPDEIKRRQQAAAELAPRMEMRHTLMLEGLLLADRGRGTERFMAWAEGDPWLAARPWLKWLSRLGPAYVLLIPLCVYLGVLPIEHAAMGFLGLVLLNIALTVLFGGRIHGIFTVSNFRMGEVRRYLRLFELLYAMPHASAELDDARREAAELGGGALRRMGQLNWIAVVARFRHVPALFFLVYLPLQLTMLFDFHVLHLLEAWQAQYGRHVRHWFHALARFEALSSLASLVYDHPGWTMPDVAPSADRLQAQQLGHPLLPPETCVANDVEIGPVGSFLLVTGSNMSGKSTLLRAVGVNVALAQAGGPVCARCLTMPPVRLATSMRVRDSLEDGVSFYMAELMRLKQILDVARDGDSPNRRTLLYLLDEILLGTNSRERHLAVERVMRHLVQCRAMGAISTHDVELATSESLAGACRCVHFCETLHDADAPRPMTFDYRLRPGVATTTNALKLLKIVGLE